MEKKNKKFYAILGVALVLVVAVVLIFVLKPNTNQNEQNNQNCEDDSCEVINHDDVNEEVQPGLFGLIYSGETVRYNAYDFIIEKMGQAQYWTYDEYDPDYHFDHVDENGKWEEGWGVYNDYDTEHPRPIHNATGWVLYDENTASFVRGFDGRLIIDFSNYKAYSNPIYNISDSHIVDIMKPIGYTNNGHNFLEEDFNPERTYDFNNEIVPTEVYIKVYEEIKNTFNFYNDIFDSLGIPLINKPQGTLTSYKNMTIDVPVELVEIKYTDRWNDDLIHDPWSDQKGLWSWYWEEDEDNVWLDDYLDIFNMQFPEVTSEELIDVHRKELDGSETFTNWAYYSPIFLVFDNKKESTRQYDFYSTETYGMYFNGFPAFYTYYVKPLYKHIFGFNGVYFTDVSELNGQYTLPAINWYEEEDAFYNKDYSSNSVSTYAIYNEGGNYIFQDRIKLRENSYHNTAKYMNDLCEHYNVENIFGDDYVFNFQLIYDNDYKQELGLR